MGLARVIVISILAGALPGIAAAQEQEPATPTPAAARQDPTIKVLVDRLDLEKYKATIKGLTQFGDRRQGTDRNRAALDWIEAQLKSYGCANTERGRFDYAPAAAAAGRGGRGGAAAAATMGPGGARRRGVRMPESV